MESKQTSNIPNEDAVAELLTLTVEIDRYGDKRYYNKYGQYHRIHGPAIIYKGGTLVWYKDGVRHREDGPAIIWYDGQTQYFINGKLLIKEDFIQWQKENGIKPIE